MTLFRCQQRLLFAAANNFNRIYIKSSSNGFGSKSSSSKYNQIPKYLGILGFGAVSYYLFDKLRSGTAFGIGESRSIDTGLGRTEASVNLDLNEIYEKTAVTFLSNPEVYK